MPLKTTRFEVTDYLDTPEAMAFYLQDALETGDAEEFADAVEVVGRARARWLGDNGTPANRPPSSVEWGDLRKYRDALQELGLTLTLSVRQIAA